MASIYKSISASNQVKVGFAKLTGIFVSAASSTPLITVYDSATASNSDPTILAVFIPTAATNFYFGPEGIGCSKGLYAVLSGTVVATFQYE
jgi:hypothetical protein